MVAYLRRHLAVVQQVDQMIDRVDRRVDALEALNLLADRQRVVEQRLQMRAGRVVVHLDEVCCGQDPGRPVQRVSLVGVTLLLLL